MLEEWDDKVGEEWETPDSNFLNPIEWLESSPNEMFQHSFKSIIESAYQKCDTYISANFREFLQTHWELSKVKDNLSIYQNEKLANAPDAFQYTLKMLALQRDRFEKQMPYYADLGLFRVDTFGLRKTIVPLPELILKEFQAFVPSMLQQRNEEIKQWMNQRATRLKGTSPNIDDFV